jgi:hypothetical protein
MNKDAEAINQLLAWLLQEPDSAISAPSGKSSSQGAGPDESETADLQSHYVDPLDSEEVSALSADSDELSSIPFWEISSLEFGEIPAVQERFYTLLKRRLRAEIERNPPLFPWETRLYDYDSERPDWVTSEVSTQFWQIQRQTLNLPIPMPDALLERLFEQCREVAQSSLREGVKLVQAVEALFPGQSQALNQMAGLVLASPSRSGTLTRSQNAPPESGFPSHYDVATPAQQMVLSLLAAREILDTMTLKVSPHQPKAERQWLTAVGPLMLEVEYQPEMNQRVRVQAELPCQGNLRFYSKTEQATAQRANPGWLGVELFNLALNQTYSLEVQLETAEPSSLVFAVHLTNED